MARFVHLRIPTVHLYALSLLLLILYSQSSAPGSGLLLQVYCFVSGPPYNSTSHLAFALTF